MMLAQAELRIGITQRHLPATSNSFARDALDADWSDWMVCRFPDAAWLAIPNFMNPQQAVAYLQRWQINSLILGGGDDVGSSPVRDALETALLDHARNRRMPVIGVCRGMQMLHVYAGGQLDCIEGHAGTVHEVHAGDRFIRVNSWHHNAITAVADGWEMLATATDGSIEAMHHRQLPWLGLMWHPERESGGCELADEWINAALRPSVAAMEDGVAP